MYSVPVSRILFLEPLTFRRLMNVVVLPVSLSFSSESLLLLSLFYSANIQLSTLILEFALVSSLRS